MSNRFRRAAVLAIIVVVVAAGAGTAYAAISGSAPVYRLGTVTPSDVTAALHEVGTLSPVHEADVPFAVSGTVKTVAVQPGQTVRAGQKLGSLDTTALQVQLTAAQFVLARVHEFRSAPKFFELKGSLRKCLRLAAVTFLARV